MPDVNSIILNREVLTYIFSQIAISTTHQFDGEPCWDWAGTPNRFGYCRMGIQGKRYYAQRVMCHLFVQPMTPDLEADHLCRNRGCVNPIHLEAVTRRENILRGESPMAKQAKQTHCYKGHSLADAIPEKLRGSTIRRCRVCNRERSKAFYDASSPEQYQRRLDSNKRNRIKMLQTETPEHREHRLLVARLSNYRVTAKKRLLKNST